MVINFISNLFVNKQELRGMDYVRNNILYSILNKCQLTSKTNLTTFFLITATLMLITSPFAINDAYANHLSDELKWQLVFISSHPACSNYHYQMTSIYNDITLKYLDLYQVEQSSYDPLCIPEKKYFSDYQSPHDLDLIILVYDKNLGQKELHGNKMGGLYSHSGLDRTQNHAVIICDCPNFYYSDPPWILTHELSHFVLYYKDYQMSVIEDVIHETDAIYDQCLESYTDECKSISTKLQAGPGEYAYSVMPVYQPATVIKSVKENQQKSNMSPVVSELSKVITKWWASDKITDGDYANAIGYVVDNKVLSSHEDLTIVMADDPIDETVTWEEVMEEITPPYWAHTSFVDEEDKIDNMLSMIPANLLSNDIPRFSEDNSLGLPDWFKETANWWANDEITNKDFNRNVEYLLKSGIIQSHTSEIFQELVNEVDSSAVSKNTLENKQTLIDVEPLVDTNKIQKLVNNETPSIYSEEFKGITDGVNSLVISGDLEPIRAKALMGKLDASIKQFNAEKTSGGCKYLDAFTNQVNSFIEKNNLSQTNGQLLLDSAQTIKQNSC